MATYRVRVPVKNVHGEQSYLVTATSPGEAITNFEAGGGELESEEIEVTSLEDPSVEDVELANVDAEHPSA